MEEKLQEEGRPGAVRSIQQVTRGGSGMWSRGDSTGKGRECQHSGQQQSWRYDFRVSIRRTHLGIEEGEEAQGQTHTC